jgi:excisionase family DNA binding protein
MGETTRQARATAASNQEPLSTFKLLTLQQVADLLGFHYETVRLLVHRGELEAMQEERGGAIRVRPDAVNAYIKNHTLQPQAPVKIPEHRRDKGRTRTIRRRR